MYIKSPLIMGLFLITVLVIIILIMLVNNKGISNKITTAENSIILPHPETPDQLKPVIPANKTLKKDSVNLQSDSSEEGKQDTLLSEHEVQKRIDDFIDKVLTETETSNIIVESFGTRIGKPVPDIMEDNREDMIPTDVPGYVAFSPFAKSADEMPETMVEIARRYFAAFPQAPRVTLSIVRGGGIHGSKTFHNTANGPLVAGKRFTDKNAKDEHYK